MQEEEKEKKWRPRGIIIHFWQRLLNLWNKLGKKYFGPWALNPIFFTFFLKRRIRKDGPTERVSVCVGSWMLLLYYNHLLSWYIPNSYSDLAWLNTRLHTHTTTRDVGLWFKFLGLWICIEFIIILYLFCNPKASL